MPSKTLIALSATAAICTAMAVPVAAQKVRTISPSSMQQAAQQHPQIVEEFGGAIDATRAAYVTNVGRKVANYSNVQGGGNSYTITTLNSPVLNAFAVPGGYVYITRQLLGLMDDEAELASVLGHEVGHIAANHSKQRQNRGLLSQIGAILVGAVTGSSQLGQLAGQVGQGFLLSYSRSQEYEADALGVRYMAAAGYDPAASASLLASLGEATALDDRLNGRDARTTPSWARTHPLSADRVKRANQVVAKTPRGTAVRNRDQFLNMVDGMLYDDDPKQGIVDGQQFLHPDLRLKFSVPQGFGIQNGTRAVSISGSSGQALFGGGAYSGGLSNYIAQVYQSLAGQTQVNVPQPRSTTINGIPAAYSTARVNTQQGQVDLTVFAYQFDSDRIYHFAMMTRAGTGIGPFSGMINSLTRMSANEAAAIRPRVIDVVTVRSGDTVQSLAGRMAYGNYQIERFLALNSLAANSRLTPGQKVKLVVYGSR
jgi:predicted Zn-dependent protease